MFILSGDSHRPGVIDVRIDFALVIQANVLLINEMVEPVCIYFFDLAIAAEL